MDHLAIQLAHDMGSQDLNNLIQMQLARAYLETNYQILSLVYLKLVRNQMKDLTFYN